MSASYTIIFNLLRFKDCPLAPSPGLRVPTTQPEAWSRASAEWGRSSADGQASRLLFHEFYNSEDNHPDAYQGRNY